MSKHLGKIFIQSVCSEMFVYEKIAHFFASLLFKTTQDHSPFPNARPQQTFAHNGR